MGDSGAVRMQIRHNAGQRAPGLARMRAATLLAYLAMPGAALAQVTPFGTGRPPGNPAPVADGIAGWLLQQQAAFHKAMTQAIGAVSTEPSAFWSLMGLAFAYGVIHAVGPGHGKAVIASYLIANETVLKRGIALSFGAAFVQAMIALGIVVLVALVIGGGAADIERIVRAVETIGFTIIAAMGLWIAFRKAHALFRQPAAHDPACDDPLCGHSHGGDPRMLQKASAGELAMTAIGAGIRPCAGAIILLVFALAKGLFLAGALSVAVMAIGTAIGTSVFALIAVKAKRLALNMISGTGALSRIILVVELLAGIALACLGAALLLGMMAPGA